MAPGTTEPDGRTESPLTALQPLAEAARAYAARKDSPNTRRADASDWRLFERWCLRQGLDPLVPDPRIVGLYLAAAANGHGSPKVSVATLDRRPDRQKPGAAAHLCRRPRCKISVTASAETAMPAPVSDTAG